MDFDEGQNPENWPMRSRSLKARAFIREAVDVIWTLGATMRLTKEEARGNRIGVVGVEATKAWKARFELRRGSSEGGFGGGGEAM